jgi:hypothetical protein
VFVRLHVDAEVAFGGGGIVADITTVGLIATVVALSASEAGVGSPSTTVAAVTIALRVLFPHVHIQGLLVLVMPVALGTLECLTGIA